MTHPLFTDLVDQAYAAFAGTTPRRVGVCTGCCMSPEGASRLLATPVREIPLRLLSEWMDAATENDFPDAIWLHLLPRILELLAQGEDPTYVGVEVSLRRGRHVAMNEAQRTVLDRFQAALLAHTAEHRPDQLDAMLCMLALGGWRPEELGRQLLSLPDPVLVPAMHHAWCTGWMAPVSTAFWEEPERSQMMTFFTSGALYDRMEEVGLQDGPLADLAAEVVDAVGTPDR